jgi:hypothetical protein
MFELQYHKCPGCKTEIQGKIEDGAELSCVYCKRRFRVMLEEETAKVGLVEVIEKELPEPLFLPRGSIRATVTILVAFASWIQFLWGRDVPGYVLSLLLAIIAYYFAFRKHMRAAQSLIFDASAKVQEPLFLPSGFIRAILICGFLISGLLLYIRGKLFSPSYLEFFVVLFGLVLGYGFSRAFAAVQRTPFHVFINHLKGAAVLLAAVCLFGLVVISGTSNPSSQYVALLLACAIS